ncbi:sip2 [Drosophila busckii]|uniref:Sip2 n=1 Tax=Drosophila busckii TaxID=30019 RepID=A0A0M3QT92_DROBS|nr:sip2 [Drosophila busckii]
MSGLEKYQDNPAWRENLLKHLLTARPPVKTKPPKEIMEQRSSLGIVLDFEALMKARKEEIGAAAKQTESEATASTTSSSFATIQNYRETIYETRDDGIYDESNESFDALERMCNKTASDPDSTLFHYLHSDEKEQVLAMAKEHSAREDKSGMEMNSLRRLLDDLSFTDQLDQESPLKGIECTQLEDVEAPSRFWDMDNTINANESGMASAKKTSPVKMVGLLRPSTIIEANEIDLTGALSDKSESTTSNSFKTAATLKTAMSTDTLASGSSCYETAADNSLASSTKDSATATTLNVDDLFYAAIGKTKTHGMTTKEHEELMCDLQESLMDIASARPNQSLVSEFVDETIIELSSSSDEEDEHENVQEVIKLEESFEDNENNLMHFKDTMEQNEPECEQDPIKLEQSVEDKENKSMHFNDTMEQSEPECEQDPIKLEQSVEDKENKSMHFNDTMEEMEYMIQKGLEYMKANIKPTTSKPTTPKLTTPKPTTPKPTTPKPTNLKPATPKLATYSPNISKQSTFILSPKKPKPTPTSTPTASPMRHCYNNSSSSIGKSSNYSSGKKKLPTTPNTPRYALNMESEKPRIFKQPSSIPMRRAVLKLNNQFDNIVSPIRAYTHKSGTAPLMSMFRPTGNCNEVFSDLEHSELELESRLHQIKHGQAQAKYAGAANPLKKNLENLMPNMPLLPKKAYISSELKEIVDKRTPMPMPSVPQIQKYLNSAMEPSVMRHEGKIKLPGNTVSHIPRRPNQSLADLSLASGDVSLYTIKDAQKF